MHFQEGVLLLLLQLLSTGNAYFSHPPLNGAARRQSSVRLVLASTTVKDNVAAGAPIPSAVAQAMGSISSALEALTGNQQALLEAVVGLDKGGIAAYDRKTYPLLPPKTPPLALQYTRNDTATCHQP